MILAFNHRHALQVAREQIEETGYRQRICKRRIFNRTWWTVQTLAAPVPARERPAPTGLAARLNAARRRRLDAALLARMEGR